MQPVVRFLLVWGLIGPFSTVWAQVQLDALPAHPRLLMSASRLATLQAQTDTVSRQLIALIRGEADQMLTESLTSYATKGFLMGPMRQVQGRVITLAMAYRLSRDKRYLERAKQELRQLAELKDWGKNHFLDVGEASLAAGLGLDWLYDDLSADERNHITQAIVANALRPSLPVQEGVNGWVDGDFNWNQVCNGGLTVGALAIAEQEPALAKQIIERAIRNVPKAGAVYAPDGSYPEGPSYWSYGTSFHVILVEALRSALGSSYGLEKQPGFLKTADYNLQMVAPSGLDFNYSDYHLESLNEPIMLWFARENRRPDLARQELLDLNTLYRAALANTKSSVNRSRHLPLELLWWEPALIRSAKKSEPLPLHWSATGVLPIAVMRSAWNDPLATFVAVKGGTPNNSHGHMDVGGFILEADGVRWAIDLGTESYDKMRAAKLTIWEYAQHSTRWNTFRVGPDGHNIIRFDGALQDITGKAEITQLPDKKGTMGNSVELTPLYRGQVARIQRTMQLNPDRSVTLEDQWTTGDRPVEAAFQWLTKAQVTKTPQGLLLRQDGKSLSLVVEASAATTIDIEDVSAAKNPQDSPNPGVSRIVIRLPTPAKSTARLSVKAVPGRTQTNR